MPKKKETRNPIRKPKSLYATHPWGCRYHNDHAELIAYAEASGAWETVAEVRPTSGASAELMATFLCDLVNENQKNRSLLQDAMHALQTCLDEDELTFTSEQAADSVLTRIRKSVS